MLPAGEPRRLVQRQPQLLHKGGFLREHSMKSSPEPGPSERASPVRDPLHRREAAAELLGAGCVTSGLAPTKPCLT